MRTKRTLPRLVSGLLFAILGCSALGGMSVFLGLFSKGGGRTPLIGVAHASGGQSTCDANHTITSSNIPFTIDGTTNLAGVYCLGGSFNASFSSGAIVTISISDVTLDMNGFAVGCTGSCSTGYVHAISLTGGSTIIIKNGAIDNMSGNGIHIPTSGSANVLIEDIVVHGTHTAVYLQSGGTLKVNKSEFWGATYGIEVDSNALVNITNNVIINGGSSAGYKAIFVTSSATTSHVFIDNNQIMQTNVGLDAAYGNVKYRNNAAFDCGSTCYSCTAAGCTDISGNWGG